MSLIKVTDLSLAYDTGRAVTELNFEVNDGDYLCIVGENGSGKSTLIKGLLGLKKPQGGTIEFSDGLKQTEIGYLPQHSSIQKDFPASVWEVVISGTQNADIGYRPWYTQSQKATAQSWMEVLGIEDMAKKGYGELSGGQQQRVLLARALCATKRLLLLDEPVAGLDPLVTQDMYAILRTLNHEKGLSIVMISHDIQSAVQEASHILHLHNTMLFFGSTADYVSCSVGRRYLGGEQQ